MLFLTSLPSPALASFVHTYICIEDANALMVAAPRTVVALAFKFSKYGQVKDISHYWRTEKKIDMDINRAYLIGAHDQIVKEVFEGQYHIVFVGLTPLGVYHLFRRSIDEFTNTATPLDELLPQIPLLMEQLSETEGFEGKIAIIEKYLIKQLEDNKYRYSDIDHALSLIYEHDGKMPVHQIVEQCQISERTLERKFRAQLGFSPKEYARLVRFKKVMQFLLQYPKTPWAELAYHFGYTDQSHLYKDFQYFTTVNPEKLMENDFSLEKIFSKEL
jgi:AraC-like DNA-binding protein